MKRQKSIQTYTQECGICSVKNLLMCYGINHDLVHEKIEYQQEGNTLLELKQALSYYFKTVIMVKVELKQFLKVKIQPFILVIHKDKQYHYVVVYKRKKNVFYIHDSTKVRPVKMTYEQLQSISANMAILVDEAIKLKNKKKKKRKKIKMSYLMVPIISIIESIGLILSAVLLQQMIDKQSREACFYFVIQGALFILLLQKSKLFLKLNKQFDQLIIGATFHDIYHLSQQYIKVHNHEEIILRMQDSYQLKTLILSFLFEWIGNFTMIVLAFIALILYSFYFAFMLILLVPIFLYCMVNFKKYRKLVEKRRQNEYLFFEQFRNDFKTNQFYNVSHTQQLLQNYQISDQQVRKKNITKNNVLYLIQTLLLSVVVAIYAFQIIPNFTIGMLISCFNILSIIIQPLFQLLAQTNQFANYHLLKQRLEDLHKYAKKPEKPKK